ncbi:hypothetical protein ACFWJS_39280 [Streptomyces sp. NPDC127061]|uniref:hypothetical protein n=1 Tax=Streptomyces sp. NPDC127061 TaxID=3347122 RepID=UPI00365B078B
MEGTTFTRERRFFPAPGSSPHPVLPRTRIRRDLTTPVYRIPTPTADKVRWAPGVRNCA